MFRSFYPKLDPISMEYIIGIPRKVREAFLAPPNSGAIMGIFAFSLALTFPAPESDCFPFRCRGFGGSMVLATTSSDPVPLDKILRNNNMDIFFRVYHWLLMIYL